MFYDLGVPWPVRDDGPGKKKKKGKATEEQGTGEDAFKSLPVSDQTRLSSIASELIERTTLLTSGIPDCCVQPSDINPIRSYCAFEYVCEKGQRSAAAISAS